MQSENQWSRESFLIGMGLCIVSFTFDRFLRLEAMMARKEVDKYKGIKKITYPQDEIKRISKDGTKHIVAFREIMPDKKREDLFVVRERERPISLSSFPPMFFNVQGGTLETRGHNIQYNFNNVNVMSEVLTVYEKQVRKFGHMEPVVKKLQYVFTPKSLVTLVGALYFDIELKKFVFDVSIAGRSLSEIIEYYENENFAFQSLRILPLICFSLGLYIMRKPIKLLIRKFVNFVTNGRLGDLLTKEDFYREEVTVKTNKNSCYKCVRCNEGFTEIIYRCGHFCICSKCNESKIKKEKKIVCEICSKESIDFERIYFI